MCGGRMFVIVAEVDCKGRNESIKGLMVTELELRQWANKKLDLDSETALNSPLQKIVTAAKGKQWLVLECFPVEE